MSSNDVSFKRTFEKMKELQDADNFDFLETFVSDLPLDEEQFVLNALSDLEKIGEQNVSITTTEKLRVLAALWAAFRADKLIQNKSIKSLTHGEIEFLDIIRKRESAALNQMSDFRENADSGKNLEDVVSELKKKEKSRERPNQQKFDVGK